MLTDFKSLWKSASLREKKAGVYKLKLYIHQRYCKKIELYGWFLWFFDSDLREKCLKLIKMLGMLLFTSVLENTFSTSNIEYNCFYIKLSHSSFSGVPITVMARCICWKYWQFTLFFSPKCSFIQCFTIAKYF